MKKKILIVAITVISIALVLFLPIPQGSYDDGGTRDYDALTYKIVSWNKILPTVDENGETVHIKYQSTSVFWYPDNQKSIDELWKLERERNQTDLAFIDPYIAPSIITREEAKGYSIEQLNEVLVGLDENMLYESWGDAEYTLSGMYGAVWKLDDTREIVVHGDGNGKIANVAEVIKYEVPIDWVDFIKLNGIEYLGDWRATAISRDEIGEKIGEVTCGVPKVYSDSLGNTTDSTPKDGASYLCKIGTELFSVTTDENAIAALVDGKYYLYKADEQRSDNENDNINNDDVIGEVQLHPLYKKFPEYFGLDGMKGVEVYVWKEVTEEGEFYYCGALSGTNRLKTEEEIIGLMDNGATMEEMKAILSQCEVDKEMVSIIPVKFSNRSDVRIEVDRENMAKFKAMFWGENTEPEERPVGYPLRDMRIWSYTNAYSFFTYNVDNLDALVEIKEGCVYLDGEALIGGPANGCAYFYLADITGDGKYELCFVMNTGSGIIDSNIVIFDYKTRAPIFTLHDRTHYDYYLFVKNGVLHVAEKDYITHEYTRTGDLVYDGEEIQVRWDAQITTDWDE